MKKDTRGVKAIGVAMAGLLGSAYAVMACIAALQSPCGPMTFTDTVMLGTINISCTDPGGHYYGIKGAAKGQMTAQPVTYTCSWACNMVDSSGFYSTPASSSSDVSTQIPVGANCPG